MKRAEWGLGVGGREITPNICIRCEMPYDVWHRKFAIPLNSETSREGKTITKKDAGAPGTSTAEGPGAVV